MADWRFIATVPAVLLLLPGPLSAQDNNQDLAKKLANPLASLISVPLQFNYDCCYGTLGSDRVTLNVQPVVPFELSDHWNLIVRTIVPLVSQQGSVPGQGSEFGLSDTTQSFFFAHNTGTGFTWAIGPAFFWPTATSPGLGSHKWGAGPTGLLLEQEGGWTFGLLANHIWSYGGEGSAPNVSNTFIQPFVSFTWPDTTSLTANMENTYNWQTKEWTAPLNLVVGHLFVLGTQRVSFQFGGRYYADQPPGGPEWGLRSAIVFLFPG